MVATIMRVALVSTFPPAACGIASYSANLRKALHADTDAKVTILAETTTATTTTEDSTVVRCWHRKKDWVTDLLAQLDEVAPDVVHLQHEESILGQDNRLPRLLRQLHDRNIGSVITLHSVYGRGLGLPGRWSPQRFQRALGQLADRIIVHQRTGCQDRLIAQGVPEHKVEVIPHGTETLDLPQRSEARAALGYDETTPVVLFLGFIHMKKGLHTLVRAMNRVVRDMSEARLLVAGSLRKSTPIDPPYNAWLRRLMEPGRKAGWLDFRENFHPIGDVLRFLVAGDVLALPYRQGYGSASGILHLALAAGKPVVCARGPKFSEALEAWRSDAAEVFPESADPQAWARALTELLQDSALRARMSSLALDLGEKSRWPVVAKQHLDVYLASRRP